MPITLMTDNDIQKGASGRVLNKDDYSLDSSRYKPGGLYDPLVFGACMRCSCGATNTPGVTCIRCKEKVMDNKTYALSYAYYDLTIPYIASYKLAKFSDELAAHGIPGKKFRYIRDVWSTMYWYEIPSSPLEFLKADLANNEVLLVNKHTKAICKLRVTDLPDPKDEDDEHPYSMSSAGLFSIAELENYTTMDGRDFDWIDQFINYKLPITSPAHRPISKIQSSSGKPILRIDARTTDYRAIIAADEVMEQMLSAYPKLVDQMTTCWLMNTMVDRLFTTNPILGSSKENMFRTEVTTRVSESLRANITSVPDLEINQILVPRSAAYEALNKQIIDELCRRSHEERDATQLYLEPSPEALEIFNDIVENSLVTLVRNPSLHRLSMQAFYPVLWDQVCIGIPGLVCEAYNADFDGDQMWIIFHTDPQRVASMRDLLSDKLWFYEKEYRSQFVPKAETLHGLYQATKVTEPSGKMMGFMGDEKGRQSLEAAYNNGKIKVSTKIVYDNQVTTYGRVRLSEILGIDFNSYMGLDKHINGKTIAPIISMLGYKDNKVERLKNLQIFGNEIATIVGLGPLPFQELYDANADEVAAICRENKPIQVKQDELRKYMLKNIKKNIDALPDSNIDDALESGAKLKMQHLLDAYAPAISDTGEIIVDGSRIFDGLSEMQYNAGAEHYRKMLSMKQDMVSVPGYGQRQLATMALEIRYDARPASPDKVGILLKEKHARGRTKLDGTKVPQDANGDNLVRVKSCISNGENKIYADELAQFKFSGLVDGASLGISFADAVMEEMLQKGLSLKHGGDLYALDPSHVTSPISGRVTNISDRFVEINGGEYKFLITQCMCLSDSVTVGSDVVIGQTIASSIKHKKADYNLSCWNSLNGAAVYNDRDGTSLGLPKNAPRRDCIALKAGVISYADKFITITAEDGTKEVYEIYDDEVYLYPEGYSVKVGDQFCTGVPNMDNVIQALVRDPLIKAKKNIKDVSNVDYGLAYNIYFNYIVNLLGDHNSEIFELIFKLICGNESGFSVAKKNKENSNFVNRMYYGWAKVGLSKAVANAREDKESNRFTIDIEDSILLPLLLGAGTKGSPSENK